MTRGGAVRYLASRQLKYLTEDRERRKRGIPHAYYKPDADRFSDAEIRSLIKSYQEKHGPKGPPLTKGQIIYNLLRSKKEQRGFVKSPMLKGMPSLEERVAKILSEDGHARSD